MALNCTMTKAMEKTIPVNAIIPDATADKKACAEEIDRSRSWAKYRASRRGRTKLLTTLAAA